MDAIQLAWAELNIADRAVIQRILRESVVGKIISLEDMPEWAAYVEAFWKLDAVIQESNSHGTISGPNDSLRQ
jgi:hypothetical protein